MMNRGRVIRGQVEYRVEYRVESLVHKTAILCATQNSTGLDPKSNIGPLFGLLFDPEKWPNIEYFSNSEVGLSYSPKFVIYKKYCILLCSFVGWKTNYFFVRLFVRITFHNFLSSKKLISLFFQFPFNPLFPG